MTFAIIAVLFCVESVIILAAVVYSRSQAVLSSVIVVHVVLIVFFAPLIVHIGIGETNLTCVLISAVVCCLTIIQAVYGPQAVREIVFEIQLTLALVFCMCIVANYVLIAPGHEAFALSLLKVTNASTSVMAASFVALWLSQEALIRVWAMCQKGKAPLVHAVFTSMVASHALYTPVFFTLAFGHLELPELIELMTVSFLFKLLMALAFTPIVMVAILLCAKVPAYPGSLRARVSAATHSRPSAHRPRTLRP